MKRSYVLVGLGAIAAIALISTAIAGTGGADKPSAQTAAKKGRRGPPGPQGPAGPQGPQGPAGATGTNGTNGASGATNVVTRTANFNVPANNFGGGDVTCQGDEKATGGGVDLPESSVPANDMTLIQSSPTNTTGMPTGWRAHMFNGNAGNSGTGIVYVICASP